MEWSQSFKGTKGLTLSAPQGHVVQALFSGAPSNLPREGPGGEIIIEINDIPTLLEEIGAEAFQIHSYEQYSLADLRMFLGTASAPDIAAPGAPRDGFLKLIEQSAGAGPVAELIDFLERATSPIWARPMGSVR